MRSPEETVNHIFELYEKHGSEDYIGEPVSQLEHMSQSAVLAIEERWTDEIILAAFFHDIGHLCESANDRNSMDGFGIKDHESLGARYLAAYGFPPAVTQPVANHVKAKRYLTWKDKNYYEQLSLASKETLRMQGGVMSDAEAAEFEKDPHFQSSVTLRLWDDKAKVIGAPLVSLQLLREKALNVLREATKRIDVTG